MVREKKGFKLSIKKFLPKCLSTSALVTIFMGKWKHKINDSASCAIYVFEWELRIHQLILKCKEKNMFCEMIKKVKNIRSVTNTKQRNVKYKH